MRHSFVLVDKAGNTYRKISTSFDAAEKAVVEEHLLNDNDIVSIQRTDAPNASVY